MKLLKNKFVLILLLIGGIAGFYYFGDSQKVTQSALESLEKTPLSGLSQKLQEANSKKSNFNLDDTIESAEAEFSQLSTKTLEVKDHVGNILGASKILESPIEATQDSKPLHEKTLEYGQYIYCKSVVKDYEEVNNL